MAGAVPKKSDISEVISGEKIKRPYGIRVVLNGKPAIERQAYEPGRDSPDKPPDLVVVIGQFTQPGRSNGSIGVYINSDKRADAHNIPYGSCVNDPGRPGI
jgi:hypothetical protein